jgi:hypothetical protein
LGEALGRNEPGHIAKALSKLGPDGLAARAVSPTEGSSDPAFALIAKTRAVDIAHGEAIEAQDKAAARYGSRSPAAWAADEACEAACHAAMDISWQLAKLRPTTLAGVAAVLRFANQIEDEGMGWPDTDTIGAEGWHYQLRKTMAEAVESISAANSEAA